MLFSCSGSCLLFVELFELLQCCCANPEYTVVYENTSAGVHVSLMHMLCYNSIAAQLANILHRFDKELTQLSEAR